MAAESGVDIPSLTSLGGVLLTLTALSGELPVTLVSRLSSRVAYTEKVIKSLKGKKLLRTYSSHGLRGFRLTSFAKRSLLEQWPDLFERVFSCESATNAPGYKINDRLRLHRMAEVMVSMLNAGVSVYPWEKPDVFTPMPLNESPYIARPTYFSSREVKQLGSQASKISSSRANGVLLANDSIFVIYNTATGLMKWANKAEVRLSALLQVELCQSRLSDQYGTAEQSAILFGSEMSLVPSLMGLNGHQPHQGLLQDKNFAHFYYLPSDHHGDVLMQLLCDPEERAKLDDVLSCGLSGPRPDWAVENDATEGDSPVLFGYSCDIPRIKRFSTALELQERTGTLYCFDFQEVALREICGPNVSIQCIDFEAYERSVFHQPQRFD